VEFVFYLHPNLSALLCLIWFKKQKPPERYQNDAFVDIPTQAKAVRFYEKLGFTASHEGMKLHL